MVWFFRRPTFRGNAAKGDVERVLWQSRYNANEMAVKREGDVKWINMKKDPTTWPDWFVAYVQKTDPAKLGLAPNPNTSTAGTIPPASSGKLILVSVEQLTQPRLVSGQWQNIPMTDPGPWAVFVNTPMAAKDLIKSLPKSVWQGDRKVWATKVDAQSLPRVLEIARKLGVEIDPKLQVETTVEGFSGASTQGAPQLEAVMVAAVNARTPQGFKARDYQLEGIEFLARHSHLTSDRKTCAILADSPGTGKTIQTLLALPRNARVILVVPNVVVPNWQIEAARWRPDLIVTPIRDAKARLDRLPAKGEILLLNYERMPKIVKSKATDWKPEAKDIAAKQLLAEIHKVQQSLPQTESNGKFYPARLPVFLIADEAHMMKEAKTQRAQAFSSISDAMATTWMLTGTPLSNRPLDLWGTLQAGGCAGDIFGWGTHGWNNFKKLMGGVSDTVWTGSKYQEITLWPPTPGSGRVSPLVPDLLRRLMLRRTKDQVLKELPPKTYETVVIEPESSREWTATRKLMDEIWARTSDTGLPAFSDMERVREMLARVKIPALLELVEPYADAGKQIIVAGAHVAALKELGALPGWGVITGETSQNTRQQLVETFQAGQLIGLAISIKAAGIGITLTAADTMIFADLDWVPGNNKQAEDRIHRIGQTSSNAHYRILTTNHPLDLHVTALLLAKQQIVSSAIENVLQYNPPKPPTAAQSQGVIGAERVATYQSIMAALADVQSGRARTKLQGKLGRMREAGGGMGWTGQETLPVWPTVAFPASATESMRHALNLLASSCDFARTQDFCGFNKSDAGTGHALTALGADEPIAQHVAYGILRKYKRQLPDEIWLNLYSPQARIELNTYFYHSGQSNRNRRYE